MNTLFKFFIQIWVLWGLAAGMALPRIWRQRPAADPGRTRDAGVPTVSGEGAQHEATPEKGAAWSPQRSSHARGLSLLSGRGLARRLWQTACVALVAVSFTYVLLGTPARLNQRMVGWRPEFGTLNGLAFMNQGSYTLPENEVRIDLRHDVEAIRWLLDHIVGNMVIAESAEVDYYRAGGTRVASMTGLSGLRGYHASEQHPGEQVRRRSDLHIEFWSTLDPVRTQAIIDELNIALVYVGPLEHNRHPDGAAKFAEMAESGALDVLYRNEGVTIYAVPGRLLTRDNGTFAPSPEADMEEATDVGSALPENARDDAPSVGQGSGSRGGA